MFHNLNKLKMRGSVDYEPVYMGGAPGGNYGNGAFGGELGLIALLALLGGNKNGGGLFGGNNSGGTAAVEGLVSNIELADLRAEVNNVKSSTKESILEQTIGLGNEFRSIDGKLCASEKEAIKAGYESRIQTLELGNTLSNKIDCEINQVKDKMNCFEVNVDKHFCALSHEMEKGFHKVEERELKEENRDLREKLFRDSQNNQTALLLQAIQNLTTSLSGTVSPLTARA